MDRVRLCGFGNFLECAIAPHLASLGRQPVGRHLDLAVTEVARPQGFSASLGQPGQCRAHPWAHSVATFHNPVVATDDADQLWAGLLAGRRKVSDGDSPNSVR